MNGLDALSTLAFSVAPAPDDVWNRSPYHVEELHHATGRLILGGVDEARHSEAASPIGVVVVGQRGAGKTHLLGWVRERVQESGGYFFLVGVLDAARFWPTVVKALVSGLVREVDGRDTQLKALLQRLASDLDISRHARRAVSGDTGLTRDLLDEFVRAYRQRMRDVGRETHDALRALALLAADDPNLQDIGEAYLTAQDERDPSEREGWGIRKTARTEREIVRDVSWIIALTGPTVIAVDQIDTLVAHTRLHTAAIGQDDPELAAAQSVAHDLMSLRELTRRTLTVLACILPTWQLIKERTTDTVQDRFREAVHLGAIPTADIGRLIVERRLQVHYRSVGFTPPYPSWPVRPEAFDEAPDRTPRTVLQRVGEHVRACVMAKRVTELTHLAVKPVGVDTADAESTPPGSPEALAALDARFAEVRAAADVSGALDKDSEDAVLAPLLNAGLTAWITELGPAGADFSIDPPFGAKPALHARLRQTLDEETEDERHWSFRGIAAEHPVAALNRLRTACTVAGVSDDARSRRRLYVVRNWQWSRGGKTKAAVSVLQQAGGATIQVTDGELRSLAALRVVLDENPPALRAWLESRRPTKDVTLLREALADAVPSSQAQVVSPRRPSEEVPIRDEAGWSGPTLAGQVVRQNGTVVARGVARVVPRVPAIILGHGMDDGAPLSIDLEALRKHTVIFAGSGSGKTVLIRRVIEECALQGVSSIVLDPNNDLARLGDGWPESPEGWGDGDAAAARSYLDNTDVVIWTPRRTAGRPLSFQPLPDFRGVADDPDELSAAIDAAVAALAPRAKVDGATTKANLGQAVLREALRHFAAHGHGGLRGLLRTLAELPEGVSELYRAERIAADLAQALTAAMVNDPLFGGDGQPVDPGVLLTPAPGKRARVSVISLVGLPHDEQRQGFVNQLQMALFAWIKKHPAGDRPLGGLLVMDEAQTLAPSGAMTACTQSTLALASQARKYGLGLVFATQAPKGLHNRIPGNAATQVFGFLNAPAQIAAAKEMAQAKGGEVPDISRLRTGQFYAALEGTALTKIRTPLCLSYHPKSPLSGEEVIERARHGNGAREEPVPAALGNVSSAH